MAFGIVKQHQGWIEFDSALGVGTCFRILLPATPQSAEAPERRLPRAHTARGGTETILVVEDEASVREFAVAVLCSQGYRVLQACSGSQALEVWKWHGPKISLLFTDVVMPEGLGGVELAKKLRGERQTLRVVLTTGHANETIGEEFRPPAGMHLMYKPYRPQVLSRTVRDTLDDNCHR
jgi:DNA-binding NtrC family response regulator